MIAVEYRPGLPQARVAKSSKPKVFLSDGRDTPLRGTCLVFTRMPSGANAVVTEQNMTKVAGT